MGEGAMRHIFPTSPEYLHYDLGTMHYSAGQITSLSAPCAAPANAPFASVNLAPEAEFKGDIVRAGLNFKIGAP